MTSKWNWPFTWLKKKKAREVPFTSSSATPMPTTSTVQSPFTSSTVLNTTLSTVLSPASNTVLNPTFNEGDVHHFCLLKINKDIREPILHLLLPWVNPQWLSTTEKFAQYLVRIKLIEKEDDFISKKNQNQKDAIIKDPFGKTWDVSLIYSVIKEMNTCLADKRNQDAWTKESDRLEYFITQVKNDRNKLGHITEQLDEPTFKEWCKTSCTNLEGLLSRVRRHCPHVAQKEIDEKIDEVRSFINEIMNSPVKGSGFDSSKYEEYRKEMEEHKECVLIEGKDDLRKRHSKRSCLEVTSYLALKKDLPVEEVFVDMVLEEGVRGQQTPVEVKDLLDGSDSLYYLEGRAGVGKTSLIKYLCVVWTNEMGEVEGLEEYDILFHLAGRDHHISSFDQFLTLSMPSVLKKMSVDTLQSILYGLRSIIIFDGYDEKNKKSTQVLSEILSLKKDYNFTLLVTSRPEATEQFREFVSPHGIRIKHIKVLGIPKSKRTEFLQKYAISMGCNHDISALLRYVQRTEYRLSHVWELPYNLSILAILWMNDSSVTESITTSSELYWKMHQVYKSKLRERLLNYHGTKHLLPSVLEEKVEDFLYMLCEISLRALVNDEINLPPQIYKTLLEKCERLQIPTEEMVAAFLKPSQSETGETYYSYPHKGVIDFLAALFIHKRLNSISNFDIDQLQQYYVNDLTLRNAPENLCQQMKEFFDNYKLQLQSSGAKGSHALEGGKIRKYLEEVQQQQQQQHLEQQQLDIQPVVMKAWDSCKLPHLAKFDNMLLSLIGILIIERESESVFDETKQEALELLRDITSAFRYDEQWLDVLNVIKCDEIVAKFIFQHTGLLKGEVWIHDKNFFAYSSIFLACKFPLRDESLKVKIDVSESIVDIGDFLSQINELRVQVIQLLIAENNITDYESLLKNIKVKFVNPENVSVDIELGREGRDRKPLAEIWKQLKNNDLRVIRLYLECDFTSTSTDTANFDDSDVIKEILPSCQKYTGVWRSKFQIHCDMRWLFVRLPDQATYDTFFESLQTATKLQFLGVSFGADIRPTNMWKIPGGSEKFDHVFVTDVTEEDVERVAHIIRGFDTEIYKLAFPWCHLTEEGIEKMLDSLRGVRVTQFLNFPENLCPHDWEKGRKMEEKARASTQCPLGIGWINDKYTWYNTGECWSISRNKKFREL